MVGQPDRLPRVPILHGAGGEEGGVCGYVGVLRCGWRAWVSSSSSVGRVEVGGEDLSDQLTDRSIDRSIEVSSERRSSTRPTQIQYAPDNRSSPPPPLPSSCSAAAFTSAAMAAGSNDAGGGAGGIATIETEKRRRPMR
jgi:hypothetical protein